MQVHAVPEHMRYRDSTGKVYPWAYERADTEPLLARQEPVEKGPFGRSVRRRGTSRSRSKTAEPRKEEDRIRAENIAAEDNVFGKLRTEPRAAEKEGGREGAKGALQTLDANAVAGAGKLAPQEPTEVLLYGFGEDAQWAAIDFYERVSNGIILEDYERQPPGQRYDVSGSMSRAAARRTLTRASLRKTNTYHGGSNWIKVTFDSPGTADLAIARSPHTIKGHLVYAEPYRGTGPPKDQPIYASSAGAQITSDTLPISFSTNTLNQSPTSSDTVSSATANGAPARPRRGQPEMSEINGSSNTSSTLPNIFAPREPSALDVNANTTSVQQQPTALRPTPRKPAIEGATRVTLMPAEMALMPKPVKASWGTMLAGNEIIGSAVPKTEDGRFDWARAGVYWRLWAWLDSVLGTDFCGLRSEE